MKRCVAQTINSMPGAKFLYFSFEISTGSYKRIPSIDCFSPAVWTSVWPCNLAIRLHYPWWSYWAMSNKRSQAEILFFFKFFFMGGGGTNLRLKRTFKKDLEQRLWEWKKKNFDNWNSPCRSLNTDGFVANKACASAAPYLRKDDSPWSWKKIGQHHEITFQFVCKC